MTPREPQKKMTYAEWEAYFATQPQAVKKPKGITERQYKFLKTMVGVKDMATRVVGTAQAGNKRYGKRAKGIGRAMAAWSLPPDVVDKI